MQVGLHIVAVAAAFLTGCLTKGGMWQVAEFESKAECEKVIFPAAKRFAATKSYEVDAKPSCKRIESSIFEGKIRTGTNFGPGPDYLGKTDDVRFSKTPEEMEASWPSEVNYLENVDAQSQFERKIP